MTASRGQVSVIVIDDDVDYAWLIRGELERRGFEAVHAASLDDAVRVLERSVFEVALIDLWLDGGATGLEAARLIETRSSPLTRVIFMSSAPVASKVVEAIRRGACEFLEKPVSIDQLVPLIERAAEHVRLSHENAVLRAHLRGARSFLHPDRLGPKLRGAFAEAVANASLGGPVLLQGDTGSGKELLARAVHAASARSAGPWIPANCASLDPELADRELFGHERGAFTGARERRLGLVEVAEGGTLFLDEIGDLPRDAQAKLLRFLDTGERRSVGSSEILHADVLVVAATNHDLRAAAATGAFREDLLFRLEAGRVLVPPLRERPEDVPVLVEHFVREQGLAPAGLGEDVVRVFAAQAWPGNVRQLRGAVETLLARKAPGEATAEDARAACAAVGSEEHEALEPPGAPVQPLCVAERAHVARVLDRFGWARADAAKALGITTRTLHRKIKGYGLHPPG